MNRRALKSCGFVLCLTLAVPALAQAPKTKSGFVKTADGAKIHYLEAGQAKTGGSFQMGGTPPPGAMTKGQVSVSHVHHWPTILFVPGWTMPAWIWEQQIAHFSKTHRVVAMDPRSQGESSQESEGLYPAARARDIKAVLDQLKLAPVLLVGWSMGVTEVAAYVDQFGTEGLAGIVLVDGIAGADFDPNMTPRMFQFAAGFQKDRAKMTAAFVRTMYRKPQSEDYLRRVTEAGLKTPTNSAVALFLGTFTSDYRPALAKIDKPVLILAAGDDKTNPWMRLYADMQQRIAGARLEVFPDCGHALFVDDAARFNSLLDDFMKNTR